MTVLADLSLVDYAVCVLHNVRYYVGKRYDPANIYDNTLVVCKYAADTNVRIPVSWGDWPGPLPGANPSYYVEIEGGHTDTGTIEMPDGEVPLLYTNGTHLILEIPSEVISGSIPGYSHSYHYCYYSQDGVTWESRVVGYSENTSASYTDLYMTTFSSVIANGIIYYAGIFNGPIDPPETWGEGLAWFTEGDIICRSYKWANSHNGLYSGTPPVEVPPNVGPIRFPNGNYITKITSNTYIADNSIRPMLTIFNNVLSVVMPTSVAGVHSTYKSNDGGYTWLSV